MPQQRVLDVMGTCHPERDRSQVSVLRTKSSVLAGSNRQPKRTAPRQIGKTNPHYWGFSRRKAPLAGRKSPVEPGFISRWSHNGSEWFDSETRTVDLPAGVANTGVLAQDRWANPPLVGKAMEAGGRDAMMLVYKG